MISDVVVQACQAGMLGLATLVISATVIFKLIEVIDRCSPE